MSSNTILNVNAETERQRDAERFLDKDLENLIFSMFLINLIMILTNYITISASIASPLQRFYLRIIVRVIVTPAGIADQNRTFLIY